MKKIMKFAVVAAMAIGMICSTSSNRVNAAQREYEVVFKAGSQGSFDTSDLSGNYTVNEDKTSITFKVKAGDAFPEVPKVNAKEGYRNNKWNKELPVGSKVEEKQIYVAKYTKLVDAVEFTVKYVDTNGVEIATPRIYTTDLGAEEIVYPKTIDGYQPDALQKRMVVSREDVEIQFVYTSTEEATEPPVIEQIVYVEGDPIYVNAGTNNPAGGQNGNAGGNAGNQGTNQGGNQPTTDIPNNDTPAGGDDNNTTDIEDNEIARGGADSESNTVLYVAGGVGIVAIIGLIAYLLKKKKDVTE